jgi:hypothetical protein
VQAYIDVYIYIAIFLLLHQNIVCSHPLYARYFPRRKVTSLLDVVLRFLFQNLVVLLIPVYKCAPLKLDPDHRHRTGKPHWTPERACPARTAALHEPTIKAPALVDKLVDKVQATKRNEEKNNNQTRLHPFFLSHMNSYTSLLSVDFE